MLTFLVGGARSGKSTLAVELGVRHDGPVVFLATAEAFDDDLRSRIDRHRAERPGWPTVEVPVELAAAVRAAPQDALVIVDCLTVWVGNLFHHRPEIGDRETAYAELVAALATRTGPTVVVSNEVGLSIVPENAMARRFRDEQGIANQRLAGAADEVFLVAAGLPLRLKG
jgi:adenosylcobinamide kinase/adenosylcobinamide-phosphate guanylyltransferase